MSPLLEFLCKERIWNKKEMFFSVNVDGHMNEFDKDEVSPAEVEKGVAAALVLVHAPS